MSIPGHRGSLGCYDLFQVLEEGMGGGGLRGCDRR